jgi:ABC-type enterochelin transport system permease subunit
LRRKLEERAAKITWYEDWLAVIIARIIMPPEDIPIGILTGLAGGIAFVFLMR